MRIGIGYDSHRLVEGRRLIIGGVEIPFEKGLHGHSDADLGALGLGDIGTHFPETDNKWKDASSIDLLLKIIELMKQKNFEIIWVDSIVIAEKPKLQPFTEEMKKNISKTGIPSDSINIKAKTNEGMGLIGRGEGIAAQAVCLLKSL
jgi:2-C-methyl-D-erythritol 2,4-cyclodiphosphate synthase